MNPNPSFKSLVPFYKLTFSLKSLRVDFNIPHPHIFHPVSSLPLLEDLTFNCFDRQSTSPGDGLPIEAPPSVPSSLAGALDFYMHMGMVETPRCWIYRRVFTSGNSLCFAITREVSKTG